MKPIFQLNHLLFILLLAITSASAWSQCPAGDVTLTTQTEVNEFATDWPNCTTVTGNLTFHVENDNDLISDLTPLSNLEVVQEEIRFFTNINFPTPLSIEGLENINSADGIVIGLPTLISFPTVWISSLAPLGGVSGSLNRFSFSNVSIDDMGTFENITSINELQFTSTQNLTEMPEFPNLEFLQYLRCQSTGFETLIIPPSISTFYTPDGAPPSESDLSGIYIQLNNALETIICESSFERVFDIDISSNMNLTSISGFESLLYVDKSMELIGHNTGIYDAFHNLQSAGKLVLEYFDPMPVFPLDEWNIRIGQNSEEFTVYSDFMEPYEQTLRIDADWVSAIHFHANISQVFGSLNLEGVEITSVTGFENLTSVGWSFDLNLHAIEALPNFTSLTYIGWDFNISFSMIYYENMTGLDNLQHIGHSCHIGQMGALTSSLQSLTGLENLSHVGGSLIIGGHPNLSDISAITDIDTVNGFFYLGKLPGLTSNDIEFTNLHTLGSLWLHDLSMEDLPKFPELISVNANLVLFENANITEISGFPNLQSTETLRIEDNINLTQVICNPELQADHFKLIGNTSLEACDSPCICQLVEHATTNEIENNGPPCSSLVDVMVACGLLNTGSVFADNLQIWIDATGQLIVQSSQHPLHGTMDIYDVSGRRIAQDNLKGNSGYYTTPFPGVANGIYFVDLRTETGRFSQKLFWNR